MNIVDVHHRLNDDLEFFSQNAPLVIKDDQGHLIPFRFNLAQRYTHAKLEEQRRKTGGWVRALVLKGRQQGMSTYINARFYHQTTRRRGVSTFILSHEGKTTDKLFDMVRRFQDNIHPALKPGEGKSNTRQMTFPGIASDYSAGTAGNEDVGRGGTAQLFHGSEAAYWEHAYAIADGALNSIRLAAGTEIILESTANGPSGLFHEMCMAALSSLGDYILIFCAWFWEDDYERDAPPVGAAALTEEEEQFVAANLSKPFPFALAPIPRAKAERKMYWRRGKVFELSPRNPEVGAARFRAIYPSNPVEAFLATGVGEIRASAIISARANDGKLELDPLMPRIGALDPAGEGKKSDRSVYTVRQGRVLEKVHRLRGLNSMELTARMARLIEDDGLDMLFVDNGYGKSIVDRLHELGFRRRVIGVWFNESPADPNRYTNKRSEITLSAADWVNGGGVSIPDAPEKALDSHVSICGGDEVHADLACLPMHRETSDGKQQVPPKEELIKLLGRSPDILDALALTFSYPVHRSDPLRAGWSHATIRSQSGHMSGNRGRGPLRSLARKRELQ